MKVYAFEWLDCIYEGAFAVVSLHSTKRGAFKAMTSEANRRCLEDQTHAWAIKKPRQWNSLESQRWRVREIDVQP